MLLHAPWGGRACIEGASVLDAFAGTGAFGLEALSRGAATAIFFERDPAAVAALRANVAACGAGLVSRIHPGDVLRPPRGTPCDIIFLDPPYGQGLVQRSVNVLRAEGWLAPGSLVIAETGRLDPLPEMEKLLAQREHGAARLSIWRE